LKAAFYRKKTNKSTYFAEIILKKQKKRQILKYFFEKI
jgi:hypothetical protein